MFSGAVCGAGYITNVEETQKLCTVETIFSLMHGDMEHLLFLNSNA